MESFIRFNSPISNKFFDIKNNNICFKSSNKTIKNLIDDISNLKPITTFLNYSSDTSLSVAKKIKKGAQWDTLLLLLSASTRLVHSAHSAHSAHAGGCGFGFLDVADAKMPVAFEARGEDLRALKFGEEHAP